MQSQTLHGDTARLSAISPGFSNFPVEFRLNLRIMCIAFGETIFNVVVVFKSIRLKCPRYGHHKAYII